MKPVVAVSMALLMLCHNASAFESFKTFAYITNRGANTVSSCLVDSHNGTLSQCQTTPPWFDAPDSITLSPSGKIAYIANLYADAISFCSVDRDTGTLSACQSTGPKFNKPTFVALNPAGTFAYIANAAGGVLLCAVDSVTGALSKHCTSTGVNFDMPTSIALNSGGTFAYITNVANNTISLCSVDLEFGTLDGCSYTGTEGAFIEPEGITINAAGTYAYIVNNDVLHGINGSVSLCAVDLATGELSDCKMAATGFEGEGNLALNAAGTYAYFPNSKTNLVTVCMVNLTDGTLSHCVDSADLGFKEPTGLALN